jgi:hypothetical protein
LDVRHVLSFAVVCASIAACLSDLPAPTKCPADAQQPLDKDGPGKLAAAKPNAGCAPKDVQQACFSGSGAGCTCTTSECPDTTSSCYPARECPEVVRIAQPGASCPKLTTADVSECACGCARCLAACDGYGPSFGVIVAPGMQGQIIVNVPLAGLLPATGKLGFYVRLRGAPTIAAGFAFAGAPPRFQDGILFNDFQQSSSAYRDALVGIAGPVRASWSNPADAPTAIVLAAAPPSMPTPALTYAQIDCVIPVLLP